MANASIEDAGAGRWRVRWRQRWQGDDEGRRGRWRQKQHTVHGTEPDAERYRADVIDDLRRQGYHDPQDHAAWPRVPPRPATPVGFVPKRKTYGRTDAPKMHHVDACLRHLRDRGASREVLVAVICQRFTGLRVGQVLGMERADLDLAAGSLTVRYGKSRSEKEEMRTVPLSRHLLAEPLFREQLDAAPPTGRIFKVKVRAVWGAVKKAWQAATEANEVPLKVWAPPNRKNARPDHAFRAAFQGYMGDERVPRDTIDFLVGHGGGLRGRHYDRDHSEDARDAADELPPVNWTRPKKQAKPDNVIPIDRSRERAEGAS